jgi:hypothetical protein
MTTNKRANRQFDANAVIIITSAAAVVQKTALTAIVARAHNPITALLGGPMTKQPRDIRRKEPARLPDYQSLYRRILRLEGHLEDTISHFYKLTKELSNRVSTLEKKSKPKDEQTNLNHTSR